MMAMFFFAARGSAETPRLIFWQRSAPPASQYEK